ncbi:protein FAR1-RELATED SEQUENCE 6-like [Gastrolobium bilobum]|uniref:protein FAR1-RELATED SEQUENCE 6-like n=1 Tax=Gastrolobium bilobum TaxID=150636 RepID=UPI002AB0476D|nr:protein FAR1-RELATED SEQUENCE 6-like [Gastrolobium bilobum]
MEDHCDSLSPLDIGADRCEEELRRHSAMECRPEIHNSDEYDVVPTPQDGMVFSSEDEVRSYYTKYANQEGFGIMTRTSKKVGNGKVGYFILACSREGNRRTSKKNPIRNCPSRKQKCEARISVYLCKDGAYGIKSVTLNHNHELSPGQVKSRNNVDINMRLKRTLDPNDQDEEKVKKSFRSLVVEAKVHENLAVYENGFGNYIQKEKRLIGKDGDGYALYKYFMWMQEQDSNFFYVIDFDDCFCMRSVFWADARSRAAYKSFGDVVKFDTTYLSNQYKVPLASFVGVNHHGQSILFGIGLLSSQDTQSFVWLFQSWLVCMSGIPPKGIITDQCKPMQNAIGVVFPSTRHSWCSSDIMKKLPQNIGGYAEYKSISYHLQNAVYDTFTTNEFEMVWKKIMEEYGLEDNKWLKDLFLERHIWVPAFVRYSFWAGMSTTQRGESKHAFFDGFLNGQTTLKQFVDKYDIALQAKAEREFEADFRSVCSSLACATKSPFERQFQSAYTHAKFLEVRKEFVGKADCNVCVAHDEGSICRYNVIEDVMMGDKPKEAMFEVTFDRVNCDVKCMCNMFDCRGILCRHSLAILSHERVKDIPCKYILDRWRKDLKRRHTYAKTSYAAKQLQPQMQRFDLLCKQFDSVAEVASEFEETSSFVKNCICDLKEKLEAWTTRLRNSSEVAVPISCAIESYMND